MGASPDRAADDVLAFWFADTATAEPAAIARRFEWWFRGGADDQIVRRFALRHARAAAGDLAAWAATPESRLALIIVLDQFSRTLHRGTPLAFAQDADARRLASDGIASGHFAALPTPWQKTFFFLPLGHSEELADLERAVALADGLARDAAPELHPLLEHSARQARATVVFARGRAQRAPRWPCARSFSRGSARRSARLRGTDESSACRW